MDVEWARMSWELEVDECVLPSAKQIASVNLLHSTGSSAQSVVA